MIGIFDSGIGGLTVVKELRRQLPRASFIYLGDNARTPYGNRSQEIIRKYSAEDVDFLIKQGATLIIAACNTASALAGDYLREKYDLPIFEVISPAAQAAADSSFGRIGVIGTQGTIKSNIYEARIKKIKPQAAVFGCPCPLLVPLVEQGWIGQPETKTIAGKYLEPLKAQKIDTLILGCTHYPLLRETIQEAIGSSVKLIDPAEQVIKLLAEFLAQPGQEAAAGIFGGEEKYFATDTGSRFQEVAEKWLDKEIKVEKAEW